MKLAFTIYAIFHFLMLPHDIKLASFKIYAQDEALYLSLNIEAEDVLTEFGLSAIPSDVSIFEEYLNSKNSFIIDNQEFCLTVETVEQNVDHLIITSSFDDAPIAPQNIKMENHSFLSIKGHHNIIKIRTEGHERDFLMNKDRTTLTISL